PTADHSDAHRTSVGGLRWSHRPLPTLVGRARPIGLERMRALLSQFARFGVVGAVGFVVDIGIFNLLRATVLAPEVLHEGPLVAKVISTSVAIGCNWIGNRHWTFRAHRGRQLVREGIEFAIVSVGGMLIGLLCLWMSRYVLGFESLLADNIAG